MFVAQFPHALKGTPIFCDEGFLAFHAGTMEFRDEDVPQ